MSDARKLLELVRLEKAALQRWLQELEQRELVILRWIEKDSAQFAAKDNE